MEEKILVYLVSIIISGFVGFGVGYVFGAKDTMNQFNDVDKVHSEIVQKDYKYCPYCGEYIKSEDER